MTLSNAAAARVTALGGLALAPAPREAAATFATTIGEARFGGAGAMPSPTWAIWCCSAKPHWLSAWLLAASVALPIKDSAPGPGEGTDTAPAGTSQPTQSCGLPTGKV